jgi:hypothetical protein
MHVYKSFDLLDSQTIETMGLVLVHSPTPLPFDLHMYGIIYSFYGARSNGIKKSSNLEFMTFSLKVSMAKYAVCVLHLSFHLSKQYLIVV